MLTSRIVYALAAFALFAVEVCIALYAHDAIIRPYVGDVLAIAFVYCLLRATTPLRMRGAIAVTLAIATVIEIAQALDLLGAVGLGGNRIARIVLGGAFDPMDFAAYGAGALLVAIVETTARRYIR